PFTFDSSHAPTDLHSFPTRRSSDLTMSNTDAGNSPGGRPLKTIVPPLRAMSSACPNAASWTAVTNTPWDPPSVYFCTAEQHLGKDRKSTRLNSSHVSISYAVFCLKK